jgi:RHS repeat-associated protein
MKMVWDFKDQLQHLDLVGGGDAYYVYDAGGQRVRKVVEKNGGALIDERICVGGFEVFRRQNSAGSVTLERETLHIMDGKQRIALVETKTTDVSVSAASLPETLIRYQVGNHLGSASLELDKDGALISYEEYHPYGTTALQAMNSAAEVSLKRYRYTGMERDEESGLCYHGARYYAPWLGRWMSPDAIGIAGGKNLYLYSNDDPCGWIDDDGRAPRRQKPSPGSTGSDQRMGDLMHKYSLATLAIRAKNRGLDVDIAGTALTGFEISTLPGGSRNGPDVGSIDLVIRSGGVYHLYDLKKSGTRRDWVNKYVDYFPPTRIGESVQRGTILENHPEILAPIFYSDPRDPRGIYAIEFNLPTNKAGATKSGQIDYKWARFDASKLTEKEQKEFVEKRGFEWVPEQFRVLNPSEDLDALIAGQRAASPEAALVYPTLSANVEASYAKERAERAAESARRDDWLSQKYWDDVQNDLQIQIQTNANNALMFSLSGGFGGAGAFDAASSVGSIPTATTTAEEGLPLLLNFARAL